MRIRKFILCIIALFILLSLSSCDKENKRKENIEEHINNDDAIVNGSFSAVSDTGINVKTASESNKKVGIFYSIWHGANLSMGTGTYDNTKILSNLGDTKGKNGIVIQDWLGAGGGGRSAFHWWGEPLFGYYATTDKWVLSRHVQMLTDAGVDYLVIDFTNGALPSRAQGSKDVSYTGRLLLLFEALDKYYKQGIKVPEVVCYTYYGWVDTITILYNEVYKAHPEYEHLWFNWGENKKPMIIANTLGYDSVSNTLVDEINNFFDIKDGAFPHETKNTSLIPEVEKDGSILWMDFRSTPDKVVCDGISYVAVSTSEISDTNRASDQWFKNTKDRTKSWDGQNNLNWEEGKENSYLYGINFKRQFEAAIKLKPDTIIVTGWNEWIAELQYNQNTKKIGFVDVADINNNRDIEPMRGGYGDNYYMQLTHFISQYKKTSSSVKTGDEVTININGSFDQWDNGKIKAIYKDYINDTEDRNSFEGYNWNNALVNNTGRNDFKDFKIVKDKDNIYFYVQTDKDITEFNEQENRMTLFVNTSEGDKNWYGYNYVINRVKPEDGKIVIEKCKGDYSWEKTGLIEYKTEGNQMMLKVPKSLLGNKESIMFKWADAFNPENGIWTFYTDGDSAPYGRLNYIFNH